MKWFLIYMIWQAGSVQTEFKEMPNEVICEVDKQITIDDLQERLPKSYEFIVVCTGQIDRSQ